MKKINSANIFSSTLISVIVISFYYLWFIFLDRRLIFLYGHMHHTPFDIFTASRHWMTGFVVSGIVLIVYTIVFLIIKRLRRGYKLSDWQIVWKYSCLILTLPLFIILTFMGKPPMPVLLSFWILIVLFCGLALALYTSNFIIANFRQSIWLFFDGLALLPILVVLGPSIAYGLIRPALQVTYMVIVPIITIGIGLFWFWIMTLLFKHLKRSYPSLTNTFLSGLVISYLLLPLLHYLGSRPNYVRYITNSENFIPNNFWLQILAFLVATTIIWLVGRWRKIVNFRSTKILLFLLIFFSFGIFLVTSIVTGKEADIWLCKNDQWIKKGNPPYEKPFKEECGIIDKAMGVK